MFVKKSFKLTFITPAFIGGADKNKAEFRVPSFIGILRYWFRTLALTATDDLNAV
ncbi:MAG: type III-B CRISPR module RAMP protein Cmr1, partial [Aquificae bacterium]|nr:type III-B CRISPR module RAMP protein Cmr1 [Aquificota bacterium]